MKLVIFLLVLFVTNGSVFIEEGLPSKRIEKMGCPKANEKAERGIKFFLKIEQPVSFPLVCSS